ncbi:hypothetical protein CDAR_423641 [Caerostris darwini]|uniref:Uncharacterized protein n=1 Tax=Caerostris darwini TaxID=1538125 RepID=A0AAV4VB91_9ARAC|nr:hypothetical protein CDAR_423641 [Caerostris darwini]
MAPLYSNTLVFEDPSAADNRKVFLCFSTICGREPKLNSAPSASLCLPPFIVLRRRLETDYNGQSSRKVERKSPLLWCSSFLARLPPEPKICKCRRSSMKGCSNESSDVTVAVVERVSNGKGCDCDKECASIFFFQFHSGAEAVISPTDIHAKAAEWASIHTDSSVDKKLPLINMSSTESSKPSLELPGGKKIPAALMFFFSGAASPRTKDMQMPEIFHERGCSSESSDVTAAVTKRVSNWKGCDCDTECGTR